MMLNLSLCCVVGWSYIDIVQVTAVQGRLGLTEKDIRSMTIQTEHVWPEGAFYALPDGYDWLMMAESRRLWDMNPRFTLLCVVPGVAGAWGRFLPGDAKIAA